MLTVLSLVVCLFFGALKSSEIVDAIEHSGRIGAAHGHSAISLASMDLDHDAHEAEAQHRGRDGTAPDGDGSNPDLSHHHHHHDLGSDAAPMGGISSKEPLSYAVVDRPAERIFRAFGPSDGLKPPPRTVSLHA